MGKRKFASVDLDRPEIDDISMPAWPREAVYSLVQDLAQVDAVIEKGWRTGGSKHDEKAIVEAVRLLADDQGVVRLTHPGTGEAIYARPQMFVSLLMVTRRSELRVQRDLQGWKARGHDFVQMHGRCYEGWCRGYVGVIFSITGTSPSYPALSVLPGSGLPLHVGCQNWLGYFNPQHADPKAFDEAKIVDGEAGLLDPRLTEAERMQAANKRAVRIAVR